MLFLLLCVVLFLIWRVYAILPKNNTVVTKRHTPIGKIVVVLGSGGHTTEMSILIKQMQSNLNQFYFIHANNDNKSMQQLQNQISFTPTHVYTIPRSRNVLQSYFTSIFTTIYAILYCFYLIWFKIGLFSIDAVLVNGPGTCIPICIACTLPKLFFIKQHCKIIFVESIARVRDLSLSGKLLYHFMANVVLVQWEYLIKKYPRAIYLGRII